MAWIKKVAAIVPPAKAADMAAFRGALHLIEDLPPRLAGIGAWINSEGNTWGALTNRGQVQRNIRSAENCGIPAPGASLKSVSVTIYCAAVMKQFLRGLEHLLNAIQASTTQQQAIWRAVTVYMNAYWVGTHCEKCRLLTRVDGGLTPKYVSNPFAESEQYKGRADKRSAARKAQSRPAGKARRASTYL